MNQYRTCETEKQDSKKTCRERHERRDIKRGEHLAGLVKMYVCEHTPVSILYVCVCTSAYVCVCVCAFTPSLSFVSYEHTHP